jgi:hypothetical protein
LQTHPYLIYPSSPSNTTLVETPQVPQLSNKSGLKNINSFDEEARISQKNIMFLSRYKRHICEYFGQENNQN